MAELDNMPCAKNYLEYLIKIKQKEQRELQALLSITTWESLTKQEEQDIYSLLTRIK